MLRYEGSQCEDTVLWRINHYVFALRILQLSINWSQNRGPNTTKGPEDNSESNLRWRPQTGLVQKFHLHAQNSRTRIRIWELPEWRQLHLHCPRSRAEHQGHFWAKDSSLQWLWRETRVLGVLGRAERDVGGEETFHSRTGRPLGLLVYLAGRLGDLGEHQDRGLGENTGAEWWFRDHSVDAESEDDGVGGEWLNRRVINNKE